MIEIKVPGRGTYRLKHLVLDVNGTIVAKGELIEGVAQRLAELGRSVEVHMVTADTRGRQSAIDALLGIEATRIQPGDEAGQKASVVRSLGGEGVCAIGNGAIDAGMLREAARGFANRRGMALWKPGLGKDEILTDEAGKPWRSFRFCRARFQLVT